MGQHLRSLRRQRALGQRRVHAVHRRQRGRRGRTRRRVRRRALRRPRRTAAPAQHTSHPAGDSAAVRSVDIVADISNAHGAAPEVTKGDPNGGRGRRAASGAGTRRAGRGTGGTAPGRRPGTGRDRAAQGAGATPEGRPEGGRPGAYGGFVNGALTLPGRLELTALGTSALLLVADPGRLDRAAVVLRAELAAIDRACSRFRSDSEITKLHRSPGARSRSARCWPRHSTRRCGPPS